MNHTPLTIRRAVVLSLAIAAIAAPGASAIFSGGNPAGLQTAGQVDMRVMRLEPGLFQEAPREVITPIAPTGGLDWASVGVGAALAVATGGLVASGIAVSRRHGRVARA
jgi:hypothetical protein